MSQQATSNKLQEILEILDWKEEVWSQFVYNTGLQYLYIRYAADAITPEVLNRSRLFWNWWKNQWQIRDEAFLDKETKGFLPLQKLPLRKSVMQYFLLHDARGLVNEIWPNRDIVDGAYSEVIHTFFNPTTEAE